ncbi:mitochondrial substrate carrier family protein isoform X2 [Tasmannia lanceolata]|uniref:mitochondrial substrate carrier family protein isoform X2 n=1 Tax=Tasmannia lanceolata TaxID=3420 RepID=UPI004062DF2D
MAARGQPSRSDKSSIKYRCIPLEVASFELADVGRGENVHVLSDARTTCSKQSEPKSSNNILTTTKFISALGEAWDYLNQPYAIFQPKGKTQPNDICQKTNVICYSNEMENNKASTSADSKHFGVALKPACCVPFTIDSNIEHLRLFQKISLYESCNELNNCFSLWRYVRIANSPVPVESWRTNGLASLGISYDLRRIYQYVSEYPFHSLKDPVHSTQIECKKTAESCPVENMTLPVDNTFIASNGKPNHPPILTERNDFLRGERAELVESTRQSVSSLYTSYSLGLVTNLEATSVPSTPSSSLCSDYHVKDLASTDCALGECQQLPESRCVNVETLEELCTSKVNNLPDNGRGQFKELILEDEHPMKPCVLIKNKPDNVLAKHRHALAGALAGTFVSLCLHPVDTIKTVIQARSTDQMSLSRIFRSIISERGITGLYRGIASNVASSAPISAVYTFTYESVKGSLLPLLPKEYYSFAHCTAGGCASLATSFIFTPSEHIKQQMQVGSHYQSCWTALVRILEKGGLPSLYAGWGAVLCRNIPHSIIKFYVYERLKQLVIPPTQSSAHPNSLQTLMCGGLAGSTAALFTTPFDVVKTRLQTQIPGSLRQYDGVFHALQEIAKQEGLKGLYRNLGQISRK